MALPRIAINGFGRIGRTILRIAKLKKKYNVVAVNDLASPEQLAYALKYDSVHGTYPGEIILEDDVMRVDGDHFKVLNERDISKLPWAEMEVDYVVESTGVFRKLSDLEKHLQCGAKRVILTVPCKDPLDATYVAGVNDHVITPEAKIISNASCTTNCAAPLAKVLHESFGIKRGLLTTIHAYTSDQKLIDSPHSDMRRSRSASNNIVPTSTGAAKAVGLVLPELQGKLDGVAVRVPVPDGSLTDFTVELDSDVDVDTVNAAFKEAAHGEMKNILAYSEDPIVSSDIVGDSHSSIFDSLLTQVMEKRMVKVVSWYDNEWGYSSRVKELIEIVAQQDGI